MRKFTILMTLILIMSAAVSPVSAADITIPELDLRCKEIPDNDAMRFMKRLKIGWNLGNTFDATRAWSSGDNLDIETCWGNPKTTKAVIQAVKAAGFGTIRIPVSWHNHVSGDGYTIDRPWLDRVREVTDWALDEGLYVILNIHHDTDQRYCYPSSACRANSEKYIVSVWKQLAERFADCDERLIFESMNEPRLVGTDLEWTYDEHNPACLDAIDCINRLNQRFVDTVRAAGGRNADRYLAVPGYCASPAGTLTERFILPDDPADNRIIVNVHAYTPYSFALQDGGTGSFSSNAQKQEIGLMMNNLYDRFISRGIPVMIDEFGARDKNNLQDRVNFCVYYIAMASARNIPCCWWDNGAFTGSGELFGILDRRKAEWRAPEIVGALMRYAGYDTLSGNGQAQ